MIFRNFYAIIRFGLFQFLGLTILVSFLLFFLNILFGLSVYINAGSDEIKQRLGIYFYFLDNNETDEIYQKINNLKEKLENEGMKAVFYGKQEGLNRLSKRIPDIVESLERHQIENPLHPTLYIMFDNEKQFSKLREYIYEQQNIIINWKDVEKSYKVKDQETRIENIINLTNFLVLFSYLLIIILIIIIVSFLLLMIKIIFTNYSKQIEIEKLLGANLFTIKLPYLFYIKTVLVIAFCFMLIYMTNFLKYINQYTTKIYSFDLFDSLSKHENIYNGIFLEFIIIIIICTVIGNYFLNRLIKKV